MRARTLIIYGSYGYTGQLVVAECKRKNIQVILAGRDAPKLQRQSAESGFPYEVVDVHQAGALREVLAKGIAVIHCAGPFVHTAQAMVEACLQTQTHYTDITGEYRVFEQLAGYDARAKASGIMVLPGTGFDVVPSDCLAVHLKNRLPSATHLQLAFAMSKGGLSRGTKRTMIEGLGEGGCIRENGTLVPIALGDRTAEIDFGAFRTKALCIPWGDIATAWRSTGIPNIEVYAGATEAMIKNARRARYINWLLRRAWLKRILLRKIDRQKPGPSREKLEAGRSYLWGRVWDAEGRTLESRLETVSGYQLTAVTAVLIAEKIIQGNVKPGYQTPAMAYGADLILEVPSTHRTDS
ncbi:MAG: saccharopine dehydrogenase NADP-binding domain-containing protein [Cyclobacteriaceae bacterium]|jgi:short subunit dehydrogenase-like uncharacterized protein|nr:saccharopine dehydrogenase NADP-binding domain-containing protein [Cyclobacteriaceae bacterium]